MTFRNLFARAPYLCGCDKDKCAKISDELLRIFDMEVADHESVYQFRRIPGEPLARFGSVKHILEYNGADKNRVEFLLATFGVNMYNAYLNKGEDEYRVDLIMTESLRNKAYSQMEGYEKAIFEGEISNDEVVKRGWSQ